ncbi:PTS fructose transporter subunit IIABC [[Mycoplasma] imitans]|uniref:PTS fructose transporter subunit IIABC n=1 Tax=[Mycoplasma] imitans TaxID=29560 RepID=UPI001FE0EE3A|nr:fructose-specific PTS transporter subunit EIIC [[Mycoplasma] imitans]
MEINKPEFVFIDLKENNRDAILKELSVRAVNLNLASNQKDLYEAFIEREKESSTALPDLFGIPHARSKVVNQPALLFARLNEAVEWDADKKKVKYLFGILVPENASNTHLEIISNVAKLIMDKSANEKLIKSNDRNEISKIIVSYLNSAKNQDNNIQTNNNSDKLILALTACPVGVAHTYLAAEKLSETAKKMGYQIKVETHGSVGTKNPFTEEEIKKADVVIVAADIGLDTSRFANKRVFQTTIKPAIHEPEKLINEAFDKATVINQKGFNQTTLGQNVKRPGIMRHILAGVSYMVPFVILGGICIAIAIGVGKLIYGQQYNAVEGDFFFYLLKIGVVAFTLMIGALGAFIANSIGGRAAIAPAFIVCVLANTPEAIFPIAGIKVVTAMGFIGSILFGIAIGFTVKWINTWRIHKALAPIMPVFVIPLGVGLFYSLIAVFVLGAPIGFVMDKFIKALESAFKNGNIGIGLGIGLGILIGAMTGFDMGGPVNKVAFLTCATLITSNIYEPMGMMAAAIPIAPLGMGLCTLVFRKKFNEGEKSLGISAILMGTIGISEGAIPFAVADPKKAIISNVVGSAVAGAIAGAFGVTCAAAHGGPIVGFLLAVSSNRPQGLAWGLSFFFLAIIAGSLVTCFMYGLWRTKPAEEGVVLPVNKWAFWRKKKS